MSCTASRSQIFEIYPASVYTHTTLYNDKGENVVLIEDTSDDGVGIVSGSDQNSSINWIYAYENIGVGAEEGATDLDTARNAATKIANSNGFTFATDPTQSETVTA